MIDRRGHTDGYEPAAEDRLGVRLHRILAEWGGEAKPSQSQQSMDRELVVRWDLWEGLG